MKWAAANMALLPLSSASVLLVVSNMLNMIVQLPRV
jgi:hypothetical protein